MARDHPRDQQGSPGPTSHCANQTYPPRSEPHVRANFNVNGHADGGRHLVAGFTVRKRDDTG